MITSYKATYDGGGYVTVNLFSGDKHVATLRISHHAGWGEVAQSYIGKHLDAYPQEWFTWTAWAGSMKDVPIAKRDVSRFATVRR